ncbi:MAG: flagellar basal body rod protein FlgC [Longimicrobiales bacterium]
MPDVDGVRGLFRGLAISASGLSAQRRRMDVISMNIANAQTTRAEGGEPYRRRTLELREATAEQAVSPSTQMRRLGEIHVPEVPEVGSFGSVVEPVYGVEVGAMAEDPSEGPMVYEPGNPDADEMGYVRYPNVNLVRETIDLMEVRRAYEANATVFDAMKAMLMRAIRI